jgi:uncharacterized SAM-binding protein YcdF (DUF218 family)
MMFLASKLFWFVIAPFNLAIFALTGAMFAMMLKQHILARKLGILAFSILLIFGVLPTGQFMVRYLETRFAAPAPMPARVSGIIILGGALDTGLGTVHGTPQVNASADRINTFVTLARQYPRARLVYTGGIGAIDGRGQSEGSMIRDMLAKVYNFNPGARLSVEDQSRTTAENVTLTKAQQQPLADQEWLLVTSASHMPRALGSFRAGGWNVTPVPADYLTGGTAHHTFLENMNLSHTAVKEIVGIAAYALTGKWTNKDVVTTTAAD